MRKGLTGLCSVLLALLLTACGLFGAETPTAPVFSIGAPKRYPIATEDLTRSTDLSLDESGAFSISRMVRSNSRRMGPEDTWTLFVYICGSDLERETGMATWDIQEMLNARPSDKVRFVIQTGGTDKWNNRYISRRKAQRYTIEDQKLLFLEETKAVNMGSAETLADFLSWGVERYPAEKMGVIFWNHGGGSIAGVCFDEQNDFDSLSLTEIEQGFTEAFPQMTDRFEFIGFDACLMATIETANILAPHGRYLLASEETESGYGWNYTAIGNFLADNPDAGGAELGVAVADSYFKVCQMMGLEAQATMSCINLSKIDALVYAFDAVARNMYGSSEDADTVSNLAKAMRQSENYGGNNKAEGYTNMVDLGSMLKNISGYPRGTEAALQALEDCVVYMRNGAERPGAHGLSLYYPLSIQGSAELGIFKDICVSPYYLAFVDKITYASANGSHLLPDSGSDLLLSEAGQYWSDSSDPAMIAEFWGYLDELEDLQSGYNFDTELVSIQYELPPAVDSEGIYSFTLTQDSIIRVACLYCSVFMLTDDGDNLIDLGTDDNLYMDWETGEVWDNFNGYWLCLPDGQPLAIYMAENGEDYNVYTSPVKVNGEKTNLRIRMDWYGEEEYEMHIVGTWAGIDSETGQSARELRPLEEGDVVVPLYESYQLSTDEVGTYEGYEYLFDGDDTVLENLLFEGMYLYAFVLEDIFGQTVYTDFAACEVGPDGTVYFDPELN